ncbi:MAG: hypothetical protein ABI175_08080 [Polyangiales bacterium]
MRLVPLVLAGMTGIAGAAPKLPAHYAALFDPKATWKYELARADAKAEPDATCKVARTVTIGKVVASEVTCDRELPIAGVYLAMPQGLYRSGSDFPATASEIGDLSMHQLLVQAKPKATATTVTKFAPATPPTKVTTTFGVRREGTMWCWYRTTERSKKDRNTDTLCFSGGVAHGLERDLAFRAR